MNDDFFKKEVKRYMSKRNKELRNMSERDKNNRKEWLSQETDDEKFKIFIDERNDQINKEKKERLHDMHRRQDLLKQELKRLRIKYNITGCMCNWRYESCDTCDDNILIKNHPKIFMEAMKEVKSLLLKD